LHFKGSIRDGYGPTNKTEKREKIMAEIKQDFKDNGRFKMRRTEHKNILIIGRTRTGKSTIKSLLVDPTNVPDEMRLASDTREPQFQAFHLEEGNIVLNIIDTPGLFQIGFKKEDIRDNDVILRTIGMCVNMEITKFHVICFCISLVDDFNSTDIQALNLLIDYFGIAASPNSCLILTHCECKNEEQRQMLKRKLMEDVYFKSILPFFKLGVYFSGSINRGDYNMGSEYVYHQFVTVSDYREELIKLFIKTNEPLPINVITSGSGAFATDYRNYMTRNQRVHCISQ
jgi:GTP-binding protein EngB required for normal cell division